MALQATQGYENGSQSPGRHPGESRRPEGIPGTEVAGFRVKPGMTVWGLGVL